MAGRRGRRQWRCGRVAVWQRRRRRGRWDIGDTRCRRRQWRGRPAAAEAPAAAVTAQSARAANRQGDTGVPPVPPAPPLPTRRRRGPRCRRYRPVRPCCQPTRRHRRTAGAAGTTQAGHRAVEAVTAATAIAAVAAGSAGAAAPEQQGGLYHPGRPSCRRSRHRRHRHRRRSRRLRRCRRARTSPLVGGRWSRWPPRPPSTCKSGRTAVLARPGRTRGAPVAVGRRPVVAVAAAAAIYLQVRPDRGAGSAGTNTWPAWAIPDAHPVTSLERGGSALPESRSPLILAMCLGDLARLGHPGCPSGDQFGTWWISASRIEEPIDFGGAQGGSSPGHGPRYLWTRTVGRQGVPRGGSSRSTQLCVRARRVQPRAWAAIFVDAHGGPAGGTKGRQLSVERATPPKTLLGPICPHLCPKFARPHQSLSAHGRGV